MAITKPVYDEDVLEHTVEDTTWRTDKHDDPWHQLQVRRPATPRAVSWVDEIFA